MKGPFASLAFAFYVATNPASRPSHLTVLQTSADVCAWLSLSSPAPYKHANRAQVYADLAGEDYKPEQAAAASFALGTIFFGVITLVLAFELYNRREFNRAQVPVSVRAKERLIITFVPAPST